MMFTSILFLLFVSSIVLDFNFMATVIIGFLLLISSIIEVNDQFLYSKDYIKKRKEELEKEIKLLEQEIKLLPDVEEANEIVKKKNKIIENIKNKLNLMTQNYIQNIYGKYVYIILNDIGNIPKDIEEIYKILSYKIYKTNNIKFITINQFIQMQTDIKKLMAEFNLNELHPKFKLLLKKEFEYIRHEFKDFKNIFDYKIV